MNFEYELLDSGENAKLERFGARTLIRPSKFSVWSRTRSADLWRGADAVFEPKQGWRFHKQRFDSWRMNGEPDGLLLRLQDNGQIGFFPEHASYLPLLAKDIREYAQRTQRAPRVLNLFAYTGMATMAALRAGASVTHVDLAKKTLDWAQANFEAAKLERPRFIREDAISFLRREVKRGNTYEVVIADPPSFSRVSAQEEWSLDQVLADLVSLLVQVVAPEQHTIFLTSHHFESGGHVMANLLWDAYGREKTVTIETRELAINESASPRVLPAGFLVQARKGV